MISFLRGTVIEISAANLVLDVNGVGYTIIVTPSVLQNTNINSDVSLPVVLVVREESMTLYGFASEDEKKLFEILQTVNGVGPKLALTILAATTAQNLADAIINADEAALTRIPGVGKKSAARLILELSDKFGKRSDVKTGWQSEVHDALTALGWSAKEANSAVQSVVDKQLPHKNVAQGLKSALELLNRIGRS